MYKLTKELLSKQAVEKRILEMAKEISRDYEGREILAVFVLKGGVYFASELTKNMTIPVRIDFLQASSYGDGTVSTKNVIIKRDIEESIEGKDVIIMEDIIDTGFTLKGVMDILRERKPASLKLAALLSKPSRREVDINIDYLGFEVPDEFVVGYGMDYAQNYRNLPYIGVMEEV